MTEHKVWKLDRDLKSGCENVDDKEQSGQPSVFRKDLTAEKKLK